MYEPKPIITEKVELNEELTALAERLAENSHDVWAVARMKEGYRWGEKRDDDRKLHPDLVPYAELSESEKDYDRRQVVEVLKVLIAVGYRIEKR